jgi:hypothetical protein
MAGCGARNPHAGHVNESNKVFDIESFMVSIEEFDYMLMLQISNTCNI